MAKPRRKHVRTALSPAYPQCGSDGAVPILYGLPAHEAFVAAEQGELAHAAMIEWE